ncbi:MAG TPA: aminodeoxychorismate synthase component I [Candidatus Binatia bacterium]|jgi:para-aminobenzoate synthetase component 1
MQTRELPLSLAPWALFRVLAQKERPFFIDAGRPWGDEWVSSMGFHPRMQLQVRAGDARAPGAIASLDGACAALARRAPRRARPVPFAGGVVLALAYEAKNEIERLPQTQPEDLSATRLDAAVYDAVVAYDHRRRRWLVASWDLDARALRRYAEEVMDAAALARKRSARAAAAGSAALGTLTPSLDRDAYVARVERVRRYITAGDVYQVNLALRLETRLAVTPLAAYGRLRAAQPVPFGGYLDLGATQVLSNSPELFLRRRGERLVTGPIKGTRRRGRDVREDAALTAALRRDPKERAEHVMIVDLERSDLGRVCRTGSVRVERFAEVASFRTLHHLVSTVAGTVPREVGVGELLRATFPGGSITGAPKVRAMEIIDEVERGARGVYTGTLGWIDASGDCDLNVAIRTAVVRDGRLAYGVGGGIVADSDPEREHEECRLKAEALRRALAARVPRTVARHEAAIAAQRRAS